LPTWREPLNINGFRLLVAAHCFNSAIAYLSNIALKIFLHR
jgi:hypothetical protein